MSQVAADKLLDLLRKSELVAPERLEKFLDKMRERAGRMPDDEHSLSKRLVEEGLITQWQADKLLAGKHRGFHLGKYKLLGAIGKGGMSHVYLAEHVLMRRRVAVKVLPRQRVKDKSYLSRFQLEARAAARLDDPNIVRVYDIDNDGDTHYIVMEYVEGRDLHQLVSKDGPLGFNQAADYIAQVAGGLEHAHRMGLVHRDIKPANCLVDANQTVKLLDMGLAKLTDDETSLTLANDENVLGTADYLAPEQALNSHTADSRADIYSLGCTLYFLLAGKPPFPEGTIPERLLKHQVEEPESLLKTRSDCPLSLIDICRRMMAKRPEQRPQTAGEVATILVDWLHERGYTEGKATGFSGSSATEPGSGVGGGPGSSSGSGIGSGILSRYTSTLNKSGTPGGSSRLNAGAPATGSPDTKKLYAASDQDTDEDIGLAPLEDEEPSPKSIAKEASGKEKQDKKAAASSGVLSGDSGEKLTSASSQLGELSSPSSPQKSIFDEVFEDPNAGKEDPIARRAARASGYDPLHPPGFVNPYTKTPVWVWIALSVAVLLIGFAFFQFFMN